MNKVGIENWVNLYSLLGIRLCFPIKRVALDTPLCTPIIKFVFMKESQKQMRKKKKEKQETTKIGETREEQRYHEIRPSGYYLSLNRKLASF